MKINKDFCLKIHPSFIIFLIFLYWGADVIAVSILIFSLILHESAHVMCADFFGAKIQELALLPLGFRIKWEANSLSQIQQLLVYTAGPLSNIFWGFVAFLLKGFVEWNLLNYFILYNLILAGINLIPAYPLDASRILECFLSFYMQRYYAKKIIIYLSLIVAVFSIGFGLYFTMIYENFLLIILGIFFIKNALSENVLTTTEKMLYWTGKKSSHYASSFYHFIETDENSVLYTLLKKTHYKKPVIFIVRNKEGFSVHLNENDIYQLINQYGYDKRLKDCLYTENSV